MKYSRADRREKAVKSPSLRGRGLKWYGVAGEARLGLSPSLRGRGLKFPKGLVKSFGLMSPSLRGRGLKLRIVDNKSNESPVALFARAWIEIDNHITAIHACD